MSRILFSSAKTAGVSDEIELAATLVSAAGLPELVGAGVVSVYIYDALTSKWFDDATSSWVAGKTANPMASFAGITGLYVYTLKTTDRTGSETELYVEMVRTDVAGEAAQAVIRARHDLLSAPLTEVAISTPPATGAELLYLLRVVFGNDQQVDDTTKRHVFFKDDGITPAISFNLKDAAAVASAREVFKKERV